MFKRFASVFLALIMVLGIFPMGSFAAEADWFGWEEEEIAAGSEIFVDIPEDLKGVLSYEYADGCVTVKVENTITAEQWKTLYEYPGEAMEEITISVGIKVPSGKKAYNRTITNNSEVISTYKNSVTGNIGNKNNQVVWGFATIALVEINGEKAVVIPTTFGSMWLCTTFANEDGTNQSHKIVKINASIEDGINGAEIDNPYYVPPVTIPKVEAGRVSLDTQFGENVNTAAVAEKFYKEYKPNSGIYSLSYNNVNGLSAEGIKNELNGIDSEVRPYTIGRVKVIAPEEEYVISSFERNGRVMEEGLEENHEKIIILPPVKYYDEETKTIYETSDTYKLTWVKGDESYVEEITVEVDFGLNNFDTYWRAAEANRIVLRDSNYADAGYEEKGVNIAYDSANGHISTSFDNNPDVTELGGDGVLAYITPPEGAKYYKMLSIDCDKEGKGFNDFDLSSKIEALTAKEIVIPESGKPTLPAIGTTHLRTSNVNGITVCFVGLPGGHGIVINWYDEDGEKLFGEYVYVTVADFIDFDETDAVTSDSLTKVTAPTPLGEGWKLTCSHFPQEGRDDAYYFQLEADGKVPEDEKIIYIPYGYLGITYEEALEIGIEPKLLHYNDDHSEKETLDGKLTEYGIEFTLNDFSPFVIAYEEEKKEPEQVPTTPVFPAWPNFVTGNKGEGTGAGITITDGKTENEENPGTGAPILEISSAAAVLSIAAAICAVKKK